MTRTRKPSGSSRSFTWRSGLWLPVIAAVLIALALIPGESVPDETVGESREISSGSATLACPTEDGTEAMIGQVVAGKSAQARSVPAADLAKKWSRADRWRRGKVSVGALVVSQTGEGSGPVGYIAGKAPNELGTGLFFSRCPELLDEGWFVGLADQGESVIQLANLGESLAVVDVYWWSTIGPIEGDNTMGIAIEPNATMTVHIGDNVPSEDVIGAKIVRRRQQVSAIALSADKSGKGTEFLLPQNGLNRDVVLAGLPNTGAISIALLNPNDETVQVKAQGVRPGGTFDIKDLEEISVKPGSTVRVDVPASAKLGGQAIVLSAEKRIAASAIVETSKDVAIVGQAEELRNATALPVSLAGQKVHLTLLAVDKPGSVVIEGVDKNMKVVATKNISIEAGVSTRVDLKKELKGATAAVLKSEGTVFAGAWMRDGDLIASTPLAPAPVSVRVPAVAVR